MGAYAATALACTAAWLLFEAQASERTGLRRELYLSNGFVGKPFRPEVSAGISLDFLDDDERLPRERFSVRWRGYWYVLDGGPIEVHGAGDDWLNVYVDGELVLRRYPPDEMHRATGTVALAAAVHELLIEYEQEADAQALNVRWSPLSDRTRPCARHRLFPNTPQCTTCGSRSKPRGARRRRRHVLLGAGRLRHLPGREPGHALRRPDVDSAPAAGAKHPLERDGVQRHGGRRVVAAPQSVKSGAPRRVRRRIHAGRFAAAAWSFLADQGGRLLMISLPGWTEGWSFNPGEVSWTLPFIGLGLVWLLARRETRFFGLTVLGFYGARVVASALWIYPLGLGRRDCPKTC